MSVIRRGLHLLAPVTGLWALGLAGLTGCSGPEASGAPLPSAYFEPTPASASTSSGAPEPLIAPDPGASVVTVSAELELTLERALALALDQHPDLALARAQLAAARAREDAGALWSNPRLVGGFESAAFDGDVFEQAEFLLGVRQTIPLAGSSARRGEVRALERESQAHQAQAQLFAIRRSVSDAFATALYAQEFEQLNAELAETAGQGLELLRARVAAGDAVAADLLGAELVHVRATRNLARASLLARRARLELAAALGAPNHEIVSLDGDLRAALQLPQLALLVGRLDQHPGVLAAHSRSRAAEAGIDLAQAMRIPSLTLDLLYRRKQVGDSDGFDVMLGLPIPVLNSGDAAIEESRQLLAAARARERSTRNTAEADLRLAHLTASRALAEIEFQEREVLPRMRELRDVAARQFELGDSSMIEALAARRGWLEVRREILEAGRELMRAWAVLGPYLRATAP